MQYENKVIRWLLVLATVCTVGLPRISAQPNVTLFPSITPTTKSSSVNSPTSLNNIPSSFTVPTPAATTYDTFEPSSRPSTSSNTTTTNTPSLQGSNIDTFAVSQTEAPSFDSAVTFSPSDVKSNFPISSTPAVAPTFATPLPSDTPSAGPSESQSSSNPTESDTAVPTIGPSATSQTSYPTEFPTPTPTMELTDKKTNKPSRRPVAKPTASPTLNGSPVTTSVQGITVTFSGVGELSTNDRELYQAETAEWFDDFFNNRKRDLNRRLDYRKLNGISNMKSTVDVTGSSVTADGLRIVYTQTMTYIASETAANASVIVLRPYEDQGSNSNLATRLSKAIDSFENVASPIQEFFLDVPKPPESGGDDDSNALSLGVIIGIAVGAAVLCLILMFFFARSMSKDKDGNGYVDSGSLPPSQFNINVAEDISTIEDPTVTKIGSGDMSVGHYGDQSVATVDYDYSKAYGGGGDTSVVSSVGGTLGDNTRQTNGDLVTHSARAALGASFEADVQNEFKEEIIVIDAPAGKLGVVIDTPDDGAPVVHAVKDSSVIADQIRVGDKLIAVDDDDVRSMTAIKVSKLISKKSANPSRKLTIVRTTHVDHP